MFGSAALGSWAAQVAFVALIAGGIFSGRLRFRGVLVAGAVWICAFLFAGLFFPPIVAVIDIVLVFAVARGDIRLS